MLWALEPVKYISAAPKAAGSMNRKSTCIPPARRTEIFSFPFASTSSMGW